MASTIATRASDLASLLKALASNRRLSPLLGSAAIATLLLTLRIVFRKPKTFVDDFLEISRQVEGTAAFDEFDIIIVGGGEPSPCL
jgi:hypothetical protein